MTSTNPSRKPGEFVVGDNVKWISSNAAKTGSVVGVLNARVQPINLGFKIDGCGGWRDHVSYIVKGRTKNGRETLYWPVVSLLNHSSQLTVAEIEWCHANVESVRALMNS